MSVVDSLFVPVLAPIHSLVATLADAFDPFAGEAAVALALIAVTLLVRVALLPLGVGAARGESRRRALAPDIEQLRRRWRHDPQRLMRETADLHRRAGVSPLAGMGSALARVPVLLVVYRLCVQPVIAGAPNLVVGASLWGAALSSSGASTVIAAGMGPAGLAVVGVLVVTAVLAVLSSHQSVRHVRRGVAEPPALTLRLARWAPYAAIAAVPVLPLAVSLYVVTSTVWTLAEREVLVRVIG